MLDFIDRRLKRLIELRLRPYVVPQPVDVRMLVDGGGQIIGYVGDQFIDLSRLRDQFLQADDEIFLVQADAADQ